MLVLIWLLEGQKLISMYAKVILVFCAQVVLSQSTLNNYPSLTAVKYAPIIGASNGAAMTSFCHRGYPALSSSAIEITPTSGGLLPVTSASAFSPELKLASENEYEGSLSVAGELPFIGTVGLEGKVPSAGMGIVNHACGNGRTRITSTNFEPLSNSAVIPAANRFGTSAVGIVSGGYSSGFDYRDVMKYSRSSRLGYFGFNENTYGGIGEGNVAVTGQLPVAGDTVVTGQVPIMGTVNYCGAVPAFGTISISGMCNCNGPYM